MGSKRPAWQRRLTEAEAAAELDRQCRDRGITCGDPDCYDPAHRQQAGPDRFGVQRDAAGVITYGPSQPCGCPLDAECTGWHPGAL